MTTPISVQFKSFSAPIALALLCACGGNGGQSGEVVSQDSSGGAESTGSSGAIQTGDSIAGVSSGDSCAEATGEPDVAPIVLVHGAWMGAWAWDDVVPLLEAAGHPMVAVELPAHGDDPTASADATLELYRDTVLTALEGFDRPAVIVGHSMAGMVISEVGQAQPESVHSLIYVGAFLPQNGDSLFALGMADPDSETSEHLIDNGDGTFSLDPDFIGEVFCADCSAENVRRIVDSTRPEPAGPLLTGSSVTDDVFGAVHKAYVRTEQDRAVSPAGQDAMLEATPVDELRSLATSHSPFLSQPQMLADTILELAKSAG